MKTATSRPVIDRILELATRLPWWAGLLTALFSYTLLHPIALLQTPAPANMGNMVASAVAQLFVFLARIGQYLLPLAFLAIAAVSGFHRRKHTDPQEPATPSTSESVSADPTELAVGEHLAALIRAEHPIDRDVELSAPPIDRNRSTLPRKGWKFPQSRARSIADAVGVLIALGALWGVYQWFMMLPEAPEDSPWALLGANSESAGLIKDLQGLGGTRSAGILEGKQPLGQFQFGPPPGFLSSAEQPSPVEAAPVEVYHSLRELETAFDAKYVPPPECYAYESNNLLVRCANHRIRARRAFIESGGKVTATLLGSWEEPLGAETKALPRDKQPHEQGDLQPDNTLEREPEWRETPEPQQDWRQEWLQQPAQDSEGNWQQEWRRDQSQDSNRNWRRGDWAQDGEEDVGPDWESQPLPAERRHWVDDL